MAGVAGLCGVGFYLGLSARETIASPQELGLRGALERVGTSPESRVRQQDVEQTTGHVQAGQEPAFRERDSREWQGMLVRLDQRALCDTSIRCGLAAACISGLCGPCENDEQCGAGEVCVLDHCLLRANVGCRGRRECAASESCVMSGYSPDARGNLKLKSRCGAPYGDADAQPTADPNPIDSAPPAVDPHVLQLEVEAAAKANADASPAVGP